MWFGTDTNGVQLRVLAGIDTHLVHDLRQAGRVAWDDVQAGRTEIGDEFDLPFGVSRRRRDGQRAESLSSVLEAQSAGKHAVARRVLEDVRIPEPYHIHTAGHLVRPLV